MSVTYAAIGYKQTILAQAAVNPKSLQNFGENMSTTFSQFADKTDFQSSSQANQDYSFYVKVLGGVTCICFTDKSIQKGQAYGMINQIISDFQQRYSLEVMKLASKLQFDREFAPIISNHMASIKRFQSNTAELQKELDEVKGLVTDNINQVMKRANQLDTIANDAEELRDNAELFADSANDLRKRMLCKKISMIVGVSVAIIVVILCIVLPIVLKK